MGNKAQRESNAERRASLNTRHKHHAYTHTFLKRVRVSIAVGANRLHTRICAPFPLRSSSALRRVRRRSARQAARCKHWHSLTKRRTLTCFDVHSPPPRSTSFAATLLAIRQ